MPNTSRAQNLARRKQIEVLVVQSNPADTLLTVEAFHAAGLTSGLSCVTEGEDALNYVGRKGKYAHVPTPDLIFLDLSQPRVSGLEVLKIIKSTPALMHIPIVVAAGSDDPRHGVLAPLIPARAAEGLRENPVFWFPRESIPLPLPRSLSAVPGERSPDSVHFVGNHLHLALPHLRCRDACHPQAHRCGTLAVRLLRYLLMLQTTTDRRRARRTRSRSCLPFAQPPFRSFQRPPFDRSLNPIDSFQRSDLNFRLAPPTYLSLQ
jgi:CheY-like chemotaxis protein